MTDFDVRSRAAAKRLIDRFGRRVTLRRTIRAYDPATGQTTDTSENHSVKISPPESFAQNLVDGRLVLGGDLRTHLAASGAPFTPEAITDRLLIDDVSYEVLRVESVASGEETAFYTLHLRR